MVRDFLIGALIAVGAAIIFFGAYELYIYFTYNAHGVH